MSTEMAKGTLGTGAATPVRARILVVATTQHAQGLGQSLRDHGHEVVECDTVEAGCAALADQRPDLIFVEPAFGETIATTATDLGVGAVLVGESTSRENGRFVGVLPETAAAGAAALVTELLLERDHLLRAAQALETLVQGVRDGSAMVGHSPVMRRLQTSLSRAADSEATVLLEGAPGSGKSTAARVIHCKSRRGNRPLVVARASELDGESMVRTFTEARGTTLILEDIEQLPMAGQQALVRHLKDRSASTGADGSVRVIVTTSAHLPELVARGAFREDLYYRLHAYPIVIPSLRERAEDIPLLADAILDQIASTQNHRPLGFTPAGRIMLESMPWPGNVAQLENVIRRAFLNAGGSAIDDKHLLQQASLPTPTVTATAVVEETGELTEDDVRPFDEEEQRLLSRALRATRGNVRRAAQLLGIGRATLYRKIQQYKLRLQ